MSELVKKEIEVSDFDSVEIQKIGKLYISQGEKESLTVECNEEILPHIVTEVKNGVLTISIVDWQKGFSLFKSSDLTIFNNVTLNYYLVVKDLKRLSASGAVTIEIEDLDVEGFALETSGATKVAMNRLKTGKVEVKSSGASKLDLKSLKASDALLELSGALKMKVDEVELENLRGQASGACSVSLTGKAASQELKLSGACKLDAAELESVNASVRLSGASKAEIWVSEHLDISTSGACKLGYKGEPRMVQSTSGSSKISHIS